MRTKTHHLFLVGVTVWDSGPYTCEVESDLEEPIAVTHHLQVLGEEDSDTQIKYNFKFLPTSKNILLARADTLNVGNWTKIIFLEVLKVGYFIQTLINTSSCSFLIYQCFACTF